MRLFHISAANLDGKKLIPKIPENILTKMGVENNTIPRISFAPSIKYALLAIGYNRIKAGPKALMVFEPSDYKMIKSIDNTQLSRKGYVPDVDKTKEHWVINSVKIKYVGKIKIIRPTKKFVEIRWGPQRGQVLKNYFWEYKVLDGDIE